MFPRHRSLTTFGVSAALTSLTIGGAVAQDAVSNAEFNRFTPSTLRVDPETAAPEDAAPIAVPGATSEAVTPEPLPSGTLREAPAAFDNRTNGFDPQGAAFDTLNEDNVVALRSFNDNRFVFEEVEHVADGLGPTFNAQSCRECHQNIVTGGASQVAEHRTGRQELLQFVESVGGSLIQSRSTNADIFERVPFEDSVSTFRISTNTLGAGFIEAIPNNLLLAIRNAQPASIRGTALEVAVLEAANAPRIGRFGWKSQHASLESFAADAYLNEMGITTPLLPDENTSLGRNVGFALLHRRIAGGRGATAALLELLEAELVVFLLLAHLLLHLQDLEIEFLDLAVHLPQLFFEAGGGGAVLLLRDLLLLRLLLLAENAKRRQMEGETAIGGLSGAARSSREA